MSPTPWDLPPSLASRVAVDAETGCWLWTGPRYASGYGAAYVAPRRQRAAHRVVYEAVAYQIPEGLSLDHLCLIHRCVNPAHLEPVTHMENRVRSGHDIQRRPIYPCGHPRTPENTVILPFKGRAEGRACRACRHAFARARRAARQQAAA